MLWEAIGMDWWMLMDLVPLWEEQLWGWPAEAKCCPKVLAWVSCSKQGAMSTLLHELGKKE